MIVSSWTDKSQTTLNNINEQNETKLCAAFLTQTVTVWKSDVTGVDHIEVLVVVDGHCMEEWCYWRRPHRSPGSGRRSLYGRVVLLA